LEDLLGSVGKDVKN
jgi:hypothetical protein